MGVLHAPCGLLQACKTCTLHSCWQMGLRRAHGLKGTAKMATACPCSLQRHSALWLHQRWASWEEQQRCICFRDTGSDGKGILLTYKECTEYIYRHLLRSLALMAKLNAASKKSCSKCFFILFLFNEWEMLPNSGLKSSIFLKKQVVEGSLWLLADTVHAQLKNMPAWPRASNQAPGRTHSFPEVMKYSKNL